VILVLTGSDGANGTDGLGATGIEEQKEHWSLLVLTVQMVLMV
jgi:hypothetical protein